jgi:gliding motility-associated-like protein
MSLKSIFLVLMLCSLPLSQSFGQIIADFTFDDTSNGAASLKKNAAGTDAISINPNAHSDGEGVYTLPDQANPSREQNLDLAIPESMFSHTESIYMEWDYRSQENFAWLIFAGYSDGLDLFRFAHVNYPDQPNQQGFHIRYATKADTATLISSGYVGEALAQGERATIAFMYDKVSGTAYIFKNGTEIWQTPETQKTPGHAFHWQSANGNFLVGAAMNGGGLDTPFLYRFRAFEETCAGASPPLTQGDTICSPGPFTLTASGGEEGRYRWYKPDGESFIPIPNEHGSTFETETHDQTTTYYVSVATENCESPLVPVAAVVLQEPARPEVSFTQPCGPGELTLHISNKQDGFSYRWYAWEGTDPFLQADSLLLQVARDTTLYVSAYNGNCESPGLPVNIRPKELPVVDAGADRRILKGESIDLSASGTFASCSWMPHKSLEFPDSPNPRVSPKATQSYIVTAINAAGCEISDTVTVYVLDKFPVPNAFSPNNDGTNDVWEIPTIKDYPGCKIDIYNKWGNLVFSSNGYQEPWDGTFHGNALPAGTYYYTLKLSDTKEAIQGTVLIYR